MYSEILEDGRGAMLSESPEHIVVFSARLCTTARRGPGGKATFGFFGKNYGAFFGDHF